MTGRSNGVLGGVTRGIVGVTRDVFIYIQMPYTTSNYIAVSSVDN